MENLLFSLNIVLPIFFLTILGFILQKVGVLSEEFRTKAITLVFYYALPCSLFFSVAGEDLSGGFSGKFVLYAVAATLMIFALGWLLALLFIRDRSQISAVAHGSYRGNFA